jgi:hypothetical protein
MSSANASYYHGVFLFKVIFLGKETRHSFICKCRTLTSLSAVTAYGFDLVRGAKTLDLVRSSFPSGKYLFAGVVDGRNIWADDFAASVSTLESLEAVVGKGKS